MEEFLFQEEIAFGLLPFETIYYDELGPHFLLEHYLRLSRANKFLIKTTIVSFEEFSKVINEFILKETFNKNVLKVTYFKGKVYIKSRTANYRREVFENGFKIKISKMTKDSKNPLAHYKTYNMGNNLIEDNKAKKQNFDTCLFINQKGFVTETAFANIFFKKGNKIYTPHISVGILNGIMRKHVMEHIIKNKLELCKKRICYIDISEFEECFITNSVIGAFPVNQIGDNIFTKRDTIIDLNKSIYFKRPWNLKELK